MGDSRHLTLTAYTLVTRLILQSVVLSILLTGLSWTAGVARAQDAKPVPALQAIPEPYDQISFQLQGTERTRLHFGPGLRRPFLYPVLGPDGTGLTRMGHPRDPQGHSHHNSVWIAHHDLNGVSYWGDREPGRIALSAVKRIDDGDDAASVVLHLDWRDKSDAVVLREQRTITYYMLPDQQALIVFDLEFQPTGESVTFGKTPFGLLGVRMAKTIGVHDGGGRILNSEGGVNEPAVLWKQARWVDYSGPVQTGKTAGITLLDHPSNPNHPTYFHVRNDGWMGTSLTYEEPRVVLQSSPLKLRYGLWVHGGTPDLAQVQQQWTAFSQLGTTAD